MTKNLAKKLATGIAIAGASALAYMPMNSDADIIDVRINSGNSDVSGSTMKISHKSGGEEDFDSGDTYWHNNESPPGMESQDKFLRAYSDQDRLMYDEPGYEMSRDNRGLDSREDFPLRFDAIAKEDYDAEGEFSSSGNYIDFSFAPGADWNDDGSGIQDYAYDLKIWGNNDESNPYFTASSSESGYGIRYLMENNDGRIPGTFDLNNIEALEDGTTDSTGGPDYGSLTLTPSTTIVPEPGTGLLVLVGGAAGIGLAGRGRRRRS